MVSWFLETHGAGDSRGSTQGVFNGGRGASDTTFGFAVAEPGVYPIRAIWYEGGGAANLEWSSIVDGERVLINDTSAGGLKAYRSRSGNPVNLDGPAVLPLAGAPATGSGLDGRYWQSGPKTIDNIIDRGGDKDIGLKLITGTRPTGVFKATGLTFQGSNDITPVREWLGADGDSYVGGEGDMNDGLLSFTGYVRIDNPGEVDIRSESDDGSVIWIVASRLWTMTVVTAPPDLAPTGAITSRVRGSTPSKLLGTTETGPMMPVTMEVPTSRCLLEGAKSPVTFYTVHLMWPQSPLLLHLPQLRLGMLVCMLPTGRPGQKVCSSVKTAKGHIFSFTPGR